MLKQFSEPVILSSAYFPNIQYVSKLLLHERIFLDNNETYLKQSFRNRCQIYGANGVLNLSIPVIKPNGNGTKTKDILIDYSESWMQVHWRAIVSAYSNSPFFEIFESEFAHIFENKEKYLIDFNQNALNQIFSSLGFQVDIHYTKKYILPDDNMFDFRNSIHPKKRLQKPDVFFEPDRYYQVFDGKHGFSPNLSFIDLLFNEGPLALDICKNSGLNSMIC